MAKPIGGKKKGEKKGVIGSAIDRVLGREEKPSVGKIVEENRKTGELIVAALRTVDFSKLKNAKGMTEEKLAEMRASVKALILKIESSQTIFDDISKLDTILLNAAETLRTAAELGYVNQAEWCINAISTGLLLLRDNVPPQRQDARDEIIANRVHYMEKYQKLITIYGKIDGTTQSIDKADAAIKKYEEDYAPKKRQIEELSTTPEGMATIAKIRANENQPGKLGEEEKALVLLARETGDLASSITTMKNAQYARIMNNESQITEAMGFRTALDDLPLLYDQDLVGEYAVVLKEINATTNRMLNDAVEVLRIEENAAREMESIMNGAAAQELLVRTNKTIEKIILPENRVSQREMLEAELLKSKISRQHRLALENQNKLQQMMTLAQENASSVINFNTDEAVLTEDNTDVQTDTNEQETVSYNLNS